MNNSNTNVILTPGKAAFFCLIVFFLYFCTLKKGLEFWNIDSFYYLTLAKSLVSLDGYKILGMPHARYPFGFPCLLAPVVGIFGYNFFVIQIFLITLAVLALFVCFIFLRRSYNEKTADIAFLLTGISYFFWSFNCNFIISEAPYFLFSLLTLITAQKYFKERTDVIQGSILLALLILASFFTRVVGISLLAAVIVLGCKNIIKKHEGSLTRLCVILFICGSAILTWFAREKMLTTTTHTKSYTHDLARKTPVDMMTELPDQARVFLKIKSHLTNHSRDITSAITSIPNLPFNLRFWWYLICLIFISGLLYCLFKRSTIVEWYLLFYIGIYAAWPTESVRFWYPVMPFIFFYFLKAIYLAKEKLLTKKRKTPWWKILFLILLASGYFLVFIPLSETEVFESGLMGYYQITVTFIFIALYFSMVTISFIFAFYSEIPLTPVSYAKATEYLFSKGGWGIWKIIFAIIIFHNLSMIAYRTYLKHQDYGLRNVGKFYFQEMGQWLRQNSNKNDVVMCDDPIALGVFSERSCAGPLGALTTQDIIDKLQKENARYIVIESNKRPLIKNLREIEVFYMLNFKEIMQVEGNLLFKIEPRNLSN